MLRSPPEPGCLTQARSRPPWSRCRCMGDSITSQLTAACFHGSERAIKGRKPHFQYLRNQMQVFFQHGPQREGEMIQSILEEKHHCRMGHSVYLLFVSGSKDLNSLIPEEQSVWCFLSKKVKSRLVLSLLWTFSECSLLGYLLWASQKGFRCSAMPM